MSERIKIAELEEEVQFLGEYEPGEVALHTDVHYLLAAGGLAALLRLARAYHMQRQMRTRAEKDPAWSAQQGWRLIIADGELSDAYAALEWPADYPTDYCLRRREGTSPLRPMCVRLAGHDGRCDFGDSHE